MALKNSPLEKERFQLNEEIAKIRQLLIPPTAPSILAPGTTKETLAAYEEAKKTFEGLDSETLIRKLDSLIEQRDLIDIEIKQSYQKQTLHQFKQDCDRVNALLNNAWLEIDRLVKKYSSPEEVNSYHQGYKAGNPLRMDIELERLKLQYPYLEIKGNRLAICPRGKSEDKKISSSTELL